MRRVHAWIYLLLFLLLAGCADTRSFTTAARNGETVALAMGWMQKLHRENLTVTITDAVGARTVYLPNNAKVRAIVNLYPDPVSRAAVGQATNQGLGNNANWAADWIEVATGGDADWYQTTLFLDLPTAMATGPAIITFAESTGLHLPSSTVEILSGTATSSNTFDVHNPWNNESTFNVVSNVPQALWSMERADNYTISFTGQYDANQNEIVPHSIQVEFTHTPDVGKPWVVNPRGDLKHAIWSDDGTNLKVMLTPSNGKVISSMIRHKFYIAKGGVTGLALKPNSLKAYDIYGSLMTGVNVIIE